MRIDREGDFKCAIVEHTVSTTQKGLPQFVGQFLAKEIWDEEANEGNGAWVPWEEYNMDIVGYLVLFTAEGKPIFHAEDLKNAIGWDGKSFAALAEMDLSETIVQIRVDLNTYNEKTTLQVSNIDKEDAIPGILIKKTEAAELKSLDAKYSQPLKALGGITPATAPATAPKVPPKVSQPAPVAPPEATAPPTTATAEEKPKAKRGRPSKKNAAAAPPSRVSPSDESGECTQAEAWEIVSKWVGEAMPIEKISELWLATITEIAGKTPDEDITPAKWFDIKESVCKQAEVICGVPF